MSDIVIRKSVATHSGESDPHTGYVKENDPNYVDLTDSGETTLHSHAGGGGAPTNADYLVGTANGSLSNEIVVGTAPGGELGGTWASPTVDTTHSGSSHADATAAAHPLNTGDPHSQYATDSDLTTHAGAADPHTVYQKESEKGAASGYASLDAGTKVPTAELGGAGADANKFLRGDQTWAAPTATAGDLDNPETGSLTVATAKYHQTAVRHTITTTQRITLVGTARLRMYN